MMHYFRRLGIAAVVIAGVAAGPVGANGGASPRPNPHGGGGGGGHPHGHPHPVILFGNPFWYHHPYYDPWFYEAPLYRPPEGDPRDNVRLKLSPGKASVRVNGLS